MEALAGYWALENPVADRLKPRFRDHLEFLVPWGMVMLEIEVYVGIGDEAQVKGGSVGHLECA